MAAPADLSAAISENNRHENMKYEKETSMIPARELAEIAVKALDSKKGKDIKLIRIDKITTLAEYFVICTGTSNTQINALCDAVEKELTEKGEEPLHREGYRGGTWVLLDYGCVVVHVFNDEARKFYSLEHLWADGEEVDLSAVLPHAEEK
jgi:iojap-like protein